MEVVFAGELVELGIVGGAEFVPGHGPTPAICLSNVALELRVGGHR